MDYVIFFDNLLIFAVMKEFDENMEKFDPQFQTSSGEESEMRAGGAEFHAGHREMPAGREEGASSEPRGKSGGARISGPSGESLAKIGVWFKKRFSGYISPAFLLMLILSFGMWYMTKLSYTYVTDIEVRVDIEGHEIAVSCMAEGEGTNLLVNRRSRRPVHLKWSDLDVVPSTANPGYVTISTESMRNAISVGRPNIKIISIGAIPEIEL